MGYFNLNSGNLTGKTPNQIADVYKEQADSYTKFAAGSLSWLYLERPAFDSNLAPLYKADSRVLDAGCGGGRIIEHLISRGIDQQNITGVDVSAEMLEVAREKFPTVRFVQSSLAEADFPPDCFDLISSSMVLHYLDDVGLRETFSNFHRWLSKDGVLFYIAPHPMRMAYKNLANYQERGWRTESTPWGTEVPFYHRTTADYLNATIRAGFSLKVVDEPVFSPDVQEVDPEAYARYAAYGASRLVVKVMK